MKLYKDGKGARYDMFIGKELLYTYFNTELRGKTASEVESHKSTAFLVSMFALRGLI